MYKKILFFGLLASTIHTELKPMEGNSGLFIPTSFRLTTALDNLSVPTICQGLTWLAGISLFYKACDSWAKSYRPYLETMQHIPNEQERAVLRKGYRHASLSYFVAGCAFTAAGFIQKYGPMLLRQLPALKQRLLRH
jgi:hypothetical protein